VNRFPICFGRPPYFNARYGLEKPQRLWYSGSMKSALKILLMVLWLSILAPIAFTGAVEQEIRIAGKTMGTTYQVTVVTRHPSRQAALKEAIENRLFEINRSMSTYLEESEISRFNGLKKIGAPFCPSRDFFSVMMQSRRLYSLTEGAWDPTVGPLVELWGFGRKPGKRAIPLSDKIVQMKQAVGFNKITLTPEGCLRKTHAALRVDLASIAKGYGVDAVAAILPKQGYQNFLVEIGGEVFVKGIRKDGKPWRIGINTPLKTASYNSIYQAVPLKSGRAMATSGTYRIFFEQNGKTYSHILDPRTGYPVQNGVVSVSVIADSCTVADGLATALMVLGRQEGLALVERLPSVECLIVVQDDEGKLFDFVSPGFFSS